MIVLLRIRLLIFMRLTHEGDTLTWIYDWSGVPYTWALFLDVLFCSWYKLLQAFVNTYFHLFHILIFCFLYPLLQFFSVILSYLLLLVLLLLLLLLLSLFPALSFSSFRLVLSFHGLFSVLHLSHLVFPVYSQDFVFPQSCCIISQSLKLQRFHLCSFHSVYRNFSCVFFVFLYP